MASIASPRKRSSVVMHHKVLVPSTQVLRTEQQYSYKILQGLNELRVGNLLCDFTLVSEESPFPVHRCVMAACSDYFKAMLTGDMKESKDNAVTLVTLTAVGLRAVVDFAYTGALNLTLDNVQEVLSAASHLQMNEAVIMCCNFLEMALTVENCVDVLNMCELYSLDTSLRTATTFILDNFESLSETDQYTKLNHNQLASLIQESSLKVVSEYVLFELVLKWIRSDRAAREQYTAHLIEKVRLPLLSGEELVEKVSKVDIMQDIKACAELLTEAKDYHIVVSKQPLLQNPRTQNLAALFDKYLRNEITYRCNFCGKMYIFGSCNGSKHKLSSGILKAPVYLQPEARFRGNGKIQTTVRSDRESIVICHAENLESFDIDTERHAFLKDAPMPMYNPCVCVVDNFLYCCGGKYDSNENNEIATARCFRYDPRFDSWYEMASMNEARKDFSMVTHGNKLFAIAGRDENMVMCTVECFSISKNDWEMCLSLSHAVYGHAATVCNNRVYISGGQKYDGYCNSVLSYDTTKDIWCEEAQLLSARSNHNMAHINGFIYVLGGNVEDAYGFPVPVTSIERYDPYAKCWTMCKATLNIREAGCSVYKNCMFIVGGINGQHYYSDIIQKFDPVLGTVVFVDKFPTRVYGKACCILTLPHYM